MSYEEVMLKKLYDAGYSLQEIADRIGMTFGKVSYRFRKYHIQTRLRSEANYLKHNPNGDPFRLKGRLTNEELFLKGIGLGLFWGEGTKKNKNSIRLGNSDPRLINVFIQFLSVICGIETSKLKFGLQIFSDMSPDSALLFWIKALRVRKNQFQKVVVTPARGFGTYREKSKSGVLTVYFHNVKLKQWLDGAIRDLSVKNTK